MAEPQIPLIVSHFKGKCTPVFSVTLEFLHGKAKYYSRNFALQSFAHAEIPT